MAGGGLIHINADNLNPAKPFMMASGKPLFGEETGQL